MDGNKKIGQYPILLNGEYISISVQMNTLTKFSKLQVGKYVVTAKERKGSNEKMFPLIITCGDLTPLTKVVVNYEPNPKNKFVVKIND